MRIGLRDVWRSDGRIGRGPYALIGVLGFAIKHNIDRFMATLVFHRQWSLFNYWIPPTKAIRITSLPREDAVFLATMLAIALPFIWVGVALTVRRLRDVGLPPWLVAVFFLPVINLVLFAFLSILPSHQAEFLRGEPLSGGRSKGFLDRMIPESAAGSAAMAVLLTGAFGAAMTALGTKGFVRYGWGLFVALPFCLGLISVLIYGYHRPRSYRKCLLVSSFSTILLGVALLALAIEGVVCLSMALPIAIVLAIMGGSIGYFIQRRPWSQAEAPPENVWQRVVSFTRIEERPDGLLRLGIAYPTKAEIYGRGVGAVRHCEFSTGTFVEPIEVWDEPWRLRFSVTTNPPPMQEWTPYQEIHPPHLVGFLVSWKGQFLLTPLPRGRTRLQGTTWYQHNMWPATYWKVWSDAIIHRIHLRVLRHIKRLAEQRAVCRTQ